MAAKNVTDAVSEYVDRLSIGAGVDERVRTTLRENLISSLEGGQLPGELGIEVAQAAVGAAAGGTIRLARRESPIYSVARPDWAAGLAPSESLGPFLEATGRPVWFDVFPLVELPVLVFRGGVAAFVLPSGSLPNAEGTALTLTAGTVWIPTNQLANGGPANSWSGIKIGSGSLQYPVGSLFLDGTLSVPVGAELVLALVPDAPVIPGPDSGAGAAATHCEAQLPGSAAFRFGPFGVEDIQADAAKLILADSALDLRRSNVMPEYNASLRLLLIPMAVDQGDLVIDDLHSPVLSLTGGGKITGGGWALPTAVAAVPAKLGDAASSSLVVTAGPGPEATWGGLAGGAAALGPTVFSVSAQSLTVIAKGATNFRGSHRIELWSESETTNSLFEASYPRPFQFLFLSDRSGLDAAGGEAAISVRADRPLRADNTRFPIEIVGTLLFLRQGDQTKSLIEAIPAQPQIRPIQPVALSNALLSVTPTVRLFLNGTLSDTNQLTDGTLSIESMIYQILPTLPDPYAANFGIAVNRDAPLADCRVRFTVKWLDPAHPALTIDLTIPDGAAPQLLPAASRDNVDPMLDRIGGDRLGARAVYWMLDLSSNADQLGISFEMPLQGPAQQKLAISDVSLQAGGTRLQSLMLPQFQWEAVRNTANPNTGDTDKTLYSKDDGGPSFLQTESVRLVPIAPAPLAAELVRAFHEDRSPSRVRFSLPFGMQALAELQDAGGGYLVPPSLNLLTIPFTGMTGARQISLNHGLRVSGGGLAQQLDAVLFGKTLQTQNIANGPPASTLGQLEQDFNASFTSTVPISRIDLSGYGASLFSRWVESRTPDVGITQVGFDAIQGRTAYERVMMVSYLWPCLARVVRTIVLERQGSGSVLRWDSGWIATTPGLFTHPKFAGIHKGAVDGMYNIREISDTNQMLDIGSGVNARSMQAVYYDADVAFRQADAAPPVRAGQDKDGRVPARRQLGFIQRLKLPNPLDAASKQAQLLTPELFDELLTKTGPLGGPVDCIFTIGNSEQTKHATNISTARAGKANPGSAPEFAVVVSGSPIFQSPGRWTVVNINTAEQSVGSIDDPRGVPLIQRDGGAFRWANPEDLLHDGSAARDYALLIAHDAQRFLFQRPKLETNSSNLSSVLPPRLADTYTMLTSQGLFPRIDQTIALPLGTELTGSVLRLAGDRLDMAAGTLGVIDKKLINLSSWSDTANLAGAALSIDSLDEWKIAVTGVRQRLEFAGLSDLMTMVHDFESSAAEASKLLNPKIVFAPVLQEVADVLQELSKLAPDIPGGVGPFRFSASFSGTTFSISAIADFKLGTTDDNAVECGMGKAKGDLQVGASLSADLLKHDIRGRVFLEIQASWQQEVFPLLYVGGYARFSISADQDGKTTLELDACAIGSVGGSIIPGLIDVEATVKYGYYIQVLDGKVHPGLVAGIEGRAKLLSGLLAFKFGVEGRVLIYPHFHPESLDRTEVELYGRIRVAGTVTVAWLIEESKSFETDFDQRLNWKSILFAAKAGLLPVP